jgi:hypothetical protein
MVSATGITVSFQTELWFPLNQNIGFHQPDRRCNFDRNTQYDTAIRKSRQH